MVSNMTVDRLDEEIKWYSNKSKWNQEWFKKLKVTVIVAAAIIPFTAGIGAPALITGALGVLVVVIESLQSLYQLQSNWISYRSTAEGLKHEKYLYYARAGPYSCAVDPDMLLAERIEALISTEHAKWVMDQTQAGTAKSKDAGS
jgi:hypothetical protein